MVCYVIVFESDRVNIDDSPFTLAKITSTLLPIDALFNSCRWIASEDVIHQI